MNFYEQDAYHDLSECGFYTICRVRSGGFQFHEAWHVAEKPARCLGMGLNNQDAVDFCESHRDGQTLIPETQLPTAPDAR